MSIKGIDHVVVRVEDIEEGIATYRDTLDLELERTGESEVLGGVKTAFFPFPKGGFVALVAPLQASSGVGPLGERGEGLHTVAVAVDNLERTVEDLQQKGVEVIGLDQPGPVFVHPRSAHGMLVQLVERS